jgi:hypothetical protein
VTQVTGRDDNADWDSFETCELAFQIRRVANRTHASRIAADGDCELQPKGCEGRPLRWRTLPDDDVHAADDDLAGFGNAVWRWILLPSVESATERD